jgi:hypothetical protein
VRAAAGVEPPGPLAMLPNEEEQRTAVQSFLYPDPEEMPDGARAAPAAARPRRELSRAARARAQRL